MHNPDVKQRFLQNATPEYRQRAFKSNVLFYSPGMSVCAQDLAHKNNWITIWDVWPCYLYNHLNHISNPLRRIHAEDREREAFFGNMSQAFARMVRGLGRVMHSDANFETPPIDGIWAIVEFPALQEGGAVEFLEKIDENKSLSEIFWRNTYMLPRELDFFQNVHW